MSCPRLSTSPRPYPTPRTAGLSTTGKDGVAIRLGEHVLDSRIVLDQTAQSGIHFGAERGTQLVSMSRPTAASLILWRALAAAPSSVGWRLAAIEDSTR